MNTTEFLVQKTNLSQAELRRSERAALTPGQRDAGLQAQRIFGEYQRAH
jgi:hypothetical protein